MYLYTPITHYLLSPKANNFLSIFTFIARRMTHQVVKLYYFRLDANSYLLL